MSDSRSFNIQSTFGVDCNGTNKAPVANAGVDQNITFGESVTLNASKSSDSDGAIVRYSWADSDNKNIEDEAIVTVDNLSIGTHIFTVTVTDDEGEKDSDSMSVLVQTKDPIDLEKGLVAHYEFEGNANDSSGNGNDGVEYGGVSYVDGVIGKAGRFDGVDDYIKINHIKNITDTNNIILTFSLWLNLNTNIYGINQVFEAHVPSGELYLEGDTVQKFESSPTEAISTDILDTDKWINLILVFDGNKKEKKIYINGILNKKIDIFEQYIKLTTGLTIGRDFEQAIQYLNGKIDDLRIYNRALNEVEIQALYEMRNKICLQVITKAYDPITGEEKEFPTPCDVPNGWIVVL